MKQLDAIFATTNVDSHGEALSVRALEGMAEAITNCFVPFGVDHDPRIPPVGRILGATVRPQSDGVFILQGTVEIFEDAHRPPPVDPNRSTRLRLQEDEQLCVADDRAFRAPRDQQIVGQLRACLQASAHTERKKANDAIALITVAIWAGAALLMHGFLGKMGEDAWDAAKPLVKQLFGTKRASPAQLLVLEYTVVLDSRPRRVDVILADPTDADIDSLSRRNLNPIEQVTLDALAGCPDMVRVVFSFSAGTGPVLQYGVLSSGFPVCFEAPWPALPAYRGVSFRG